MRSTFAHWLIYRTPVGPTVGAFILLALAVGLVL
jgi:hypothetical protein